MYIFAVNRGALRVDFRDLSGGQVRNEEGIVASPQRAARIAKTAEYLTDRIARIVLRKPKRSGDQGEYYPPHTPIVLTPSARLTCSGTACLLPGLPREDYWLRRTLRE